MLYSDGESSNAKEGGSRDTSSNGDDQTKPSDSVMTKKSVVSLLPSGGGNKDQLINNGSQIIQNVPIKKKPREYVPGRINDLNPKKTNEEEL